MITASVVLYNTEISDIERVVSSFSPSENRKLFIVDNSPSHTDLPFKISSDKNIEYVFTGHNGGYGAGHNIALRNALAMRSDFHVVLNPDTVFKPDVIDSLVQFMKSDERIGQCMPRIISPDGELQYLCKLLPSPFDLIFKRFFPKKIVEKFAVKFQLKFTGYDTIMDVPYLSGCFMFFRVAALREIGIFDERFFMYPEDIDITRRMHQKFRTVYFPAVTIIHAHAAESYHSAKMLKIHIQNIIRYFNKWGWFFDRDRYKVNCKILSDLHWKEFKRRKAEKV